MGSWMKSWKRQSADRTFDKVWHRNCHSSALVHYHSKEKKRTNTKKSSVDNSYTNSVQENRCMRHITFLRINYIIFQPEYYPF